MATLVGKDIRNHIVVIIAVVSFLIGMGPFQSYAYAAELEPRSLRLSDAQAAAQTNVRYDLRFSNPGIGTLGSVRVLFCSNTSLIDDSCIPPVGFDLSGASILSQSGTGLFTISGSSTQNELIFTRPPVIEPAGAMAFTLLNVRNPSTEGSYYARILTYPSSDGSGPYTDAGGLAFTINPAIGVDAEVPPYIKFCIGESITNFDCTTATEPFSDLGDLSPNVTSAAQSQMVIATNGQNGYSMWVMGATMMSGGNVINAMNGGTSVKGTSQFGMNLVANNAPQVGQNPVGPGVAGVTANYSQQNHFRFTTGDILATATQPDDNRKYTVSYIINIPSGTPGGLYSTTLTYVCLANF